MVLLVVFFFFLIKGLKANIKLVEPIFHNFVWQNIYEDNEIFVHEEYLAEIRSVAERMPIFILITLRRTQLIISTPTLVCFDLFFSD